MDYTLSSFIESLVELRGQLVANDTIANVTLLSLVDKQLEVLIPQIKIEPQY